MIRVTAFIVSQRAGVYKVEASAEGVKAKFTFDIKAASDRDAAMEAIRRVERFESATQSKEGPN